MRVARLAMLDFGSRLVAGVTVAEPAPDTIRAGKCEIRIVEMVPRDWRIKIHSVAVGQFARVGKLRGIRSKS